MSSRPNPPSPPPPPASPADSPLERDLALVLEQAALRPAASVSVCCFIAGRPAQAQATYQRCVEMLGNARAPAIVGLEQLSIEAQRQAVALAEEIRGKLLLDDAAGAPQPAITQTATLGHVLSSDLWLWVAPAEGKREASAIGNWLIARRGAAAMVDMPGDLATVLELRERLSPQLAQARRVAVLLPAGLDPRVVGQWHKLAAQVQGLVRMAVMQLPARGAMNRRGAIEVATWQTGFSLEKGGIDFADGSPRPCPGFRPLMELGAVDLLLDFQPVTEGSGCPRICVGAGPCAAADVCLVVPQVRLGMEGQVMRFDGIVLSLCPPEEAGEPDAQALLLAELRRRWAGRRT